MRFSYKIKRLLILWIKSKSDQYKTNEIGEHLRFHQNLNR